MFGIDLMALCYNNSQRIPAIRYYYRHFDKGGMDFAEYTED